MSEAVEQHEPTQQPGDDGSEGEKIRIAQHFLLSSPPGEMDEVLNDVRKLVPEGLLSDTFLCNVARTYNTTFGRIILDNDGRMILVTKAGEVDATHILDVDMRRVLGVDHARGVLLAEDARPVTSEMDEGQEQQRVEVARTVQEYVESQYVTDMAAAAVYASEGSLHVVIYGERVNLRNYWSGSWLSVWKVDTETRQLSGTVKVRAHYFEEGNVQMQTSKAYGPLSLSETELAAAVVQAIASCEQQLQQGLEAMYANMGDDTFKAMRRRLTVAKTRMEWNTHAHRLARQMGK